MCLADLHVGSALTNARDVQRLFPVWTSEWIFNTRYRMQDELSGCPNEIPDRDSDRGRDSTISRGFENIDQNANSHRGAHVPDGCAR